MTGKDGSGSCPGAAGMFVGTRAGGAVPAWTEASPTLVCVPVMIAWRGTMLGCCYNCK